MKIVYKPRVAGNLRSLQEYMAAGNPAATFHMVQLIREHIAGSAAQPRSGRLR
jgi:plasmid stabilization system protein ParE